MNRESIEQTVSEISTKVTYTGAGTGALGWLLSSNFIGLVGVGVALAGFLVNWYYKHKQNQREEAEYLKRMDKLTTRPDKL